VGHALVLAGGIDGPPGAPVVVLGNSLGTSRQVWDRPATALERRCRLLRYELPGHGGSAATPGPYTIGQLGSGVLALLDAHGVERVAYCGISIGGMIGMWLAANHPSRISALGLVCTSAFLPPADGWHERAARVRAVGVKSISATVVGRWFTPAFASREPSVPAAVLAEFERTNPEGYAGCCEAIASMDLRASLGSVTAPTLVVSASDDPATPPAHGAAITAAISGSRLVVVRGAAHLATVSAPEEVAAALLGHLDELAFRPHAGEPGQILGHDDPPNCQGQYVSFDGRYDSGK
jgi:3-oxoadipate enol-lactonase